MNSRVLATCLLLLLTMSFGFIATTQAAPGEGDWVTSYRVSDPETGQLMVEVDFVTGENRTVSSIFGGAEIAVTFTITVAATAPTTMLRMKTNMMPSQIEDVFWRLVSQDYELTAYNPASQEVTFFQSKGELIMTLYGRIPTTVVRDKPVQYIVLTLYGPAGETLDNIQVKVVTAAMDEYEMIYLQKEEKLQSLKDSGVAPGYIELYENVLNESRVQANLGNVEGALGILNTLSVANEPTSSSVEGLFLPVVGALVAVSAVLGFMFVRGRGKMQYVLMVLEDQIRDLEGLTLRASRVDRTISTSLESVRDRLKNVVGM